MWSTLPKASLAAYYTIHIVTLSFGVWCWVPFSMAEPWLFPLQPTDALTLGLLSWKMVSLGSFHFHKLIFNYACSHPWFPAFTPYSAWCVDTTLRPLLSKSLTRTPPPHLSSFHTTTQVGTNTGGLNAWKKVGWVGVTNLLHIRQNLAQGIDPGYSCTQKL